MKSRLDAYLWAQAKRLAKVTTDEQYLDERRRGIPLVSAAQMSPAVYKLYGQLLLMQYYSEKIGGDRYREALENGLISKEGREFFERIVREEYGHARLVWFGEGVDLPGPLAVLDLDPTLFLAERPEEQVNILHIFRHPGFQSIHSVIAFNVVQDLAADCQLDDYADGHFIFWTECIRRIEKEEKGHVEHGKRWLLSLTKSLEDKLLFQRYLDYWFLHGMDTFGQPDESSRVMKDILRFGIRNKTNDEGRAGFLHKLAALVEPRGLTLPPWTYREDRPFAD